MPTASFLYERVFPSSLTSPGTYPSGAGVAGVVSSMLASTEGELLFSGAEALLEDGTEEHPARAAQKAKQARAMMRNLVFDTGDPFFESTSR